MHFSDGQLPQEYLRYIGWKRTFVGAAGVLLAAALVY
jgi:hypothetical protein